MKATANILVHESQFPENVRRDLIKSLRTRKINHKFHYDSIKQAQKWLALHEIYSPTRNDENCRAIYEKSFATAVAKIKSRNVHVIGLGCGGGQKDARLLKLLKVNGKQIFYTPCDVSAAMVLVARQTALTVLPEKNCFPFVCDLATANDLAAVFKKQSPCDTTRLMTFFGMIPNFEPNEILPKLAALIGPKDFLLFSANLAPGKNYVVGMKKILPQYDNAPTREWLLAFLTDLGIEQKGGRLEFEIEAAKSDLKKVVARFHFSRRCRFKIEAEQFEFRCGESIRLFFSYRYTPLLTRKILARHKLQVVGEWMTQSAEEGVFFCQSKQSVAI